MFKFTIENNVLITSLRNEGSSTLPVKVVNKGKKRNIPKLSKMLLTKERQIISKKPLR
jgi:hypothetical protein